MRVFAETRESDIWFHCQNGEFVPQLGVLRLPMFLGRATAGLVQVTVLPPQPYADIWVEGHPDVWPSKKLRAFRDILVSYCKKHRGQFVA